MTRGVYIQDRAFFETAAIFTNVFCDSSRNSGSDSSVVAIMIVVA